MQANSIQITTDRSAAYDALQRVILQLATSKPELRSNSNANSFTVRKVARQPDGHAEFKSLVEQALEAYRNYMKAVGKGA